LSTSNVAQRTFGTMKRLTRCCFCTDVAHGATILAILFILGSAISALFFIGGLANKGSIVGAYSDVIEVTEKELSDLRLDDEAERAIKEALIISYQGFIRFLPIILTAGLMESLAGLAMSGCLLYGLRNNRHVYMLPFLIVYMIEYIVNGLIFLACIYFAFAIGGTAAGIVCLIIGVAIAYEGFYYWWVVQSQYLNVKDAANAGEYMGESNIALQI